MGSCFAHYDKGCSTEPRKHFKAAAAASRLRGLWQHIGNERQTVRTSCKPNGNYAACKSGKCDMLPGVLQLSMSGLVSMCCICKTSASAHSSSQG